MLNQNRHPLLRCALVSGAVLALASQPALGQTAAPPPGLPDPAQTVQQQAPTGPVLELTMEEAVNLAMQNNLGLQSARLSMDIAASQIQGARAAFLPRVSTDFSRNSSSNPGVQNADGTRSVTSSTQIDNSSRVQGQLPWYGTVYNVSWNAFRRETPGANATFNPSLSSSFGFNVTQPLWGGLTTDSARAGLEMSQRSQVITDLSLRQTQVLLEVNARLAYLNLVAAREQYNVAVENLNIAEQSLRNSRARVDVGVAPETDVIGDEAQVASNQVSVIQSEAAIDAREDDLRAIILDPNQPDYWTVNIVPTETPELTDREINVEAAIESALENRIDRQIALRGLELTDLNLRVSRDITRPTLDFVLSYRAAASGGRSESLGNRSFGSVLGDTFGGDFPSWTTAMSFSYPIGRTSAEAALARAEIQRRQEVISLRELDLQIIQQVRDAARQVANAYRRVQAARAALRASELNLDAEQRRLAVGLSRSLDVQIRQQDLARARVTELNAVIDYNRALINLDRVQIVR